MSELKLGQLIEGEAHRDAIHVAVAPVTAGDKLAPGAHVGFLDDGTVGCAVNSIGIVDPFLANTVKEGERFYLWLYPNTVTGMRHEWQHPAFTSNMPKSGKDLSVSQQWLHDFAARVEQTYNRLMEAAENYDEHGDYTRDDSESYKNVPYEEWERFWIHWSAVTGKTPRVKDGYFYTCSC